MLEMKWHTSALGKRGAVSKAARQPAEGRGVQRWVTQHRRVYTWGTAKPQTCTYRAQKASERELVGSKLLTIFCIWLVNLLPKCVKEQIHLRNYWCSNYGAGEPTHHAHGIGSPWRSLVKAGTHQPLGADAWLETGMLQKSPCVGVCQAGGSHSRGGSSFAQTVLRSRAFDGDHPTHKGRAPSLQSNRYVPTPCWWIFAYLLQLL